MKKTAVEWLYETLWKQTDFSLPNNILEQAKAKNLTERWSNHENLVFRDPEIIDFGGLDGPGCSRNHSRRRGPSHPTFSKGFPSCRGRRDPQKTIYGRHKNHV